MPLLTHLSKYAYVLCSRQDFNQPAHSSIVKVLVKGIPWLHKGPWTNWWADQKLQSSQQHESIIRALCGKVSCIKCILKVVLCWLICCYLRTIWEIHSETSHGQMLKVSTFKMDRALPGKGCSSCIKVEAFQERLEGKKKKRTKPTSCVSLEPQWSKNLQKPVAKEIKSNLSWKCFLHCSSNYDLHCSG